MASLSRYFEINDLYNKIILTIFAKSLEKTFIIYYNIVVILDECPRNMNFQPQKLSKR